MINEDDNLESIKIGCFGDSCVGKTYFIRKYANDIKNLDSNLLTVELIIVLQKEAYLMEINIKLPFMIMHEEKDIKLYFYIKLDIVMELF